MPSLPTIGQSPWAQDLLDWLAVSHNPDGTLNGLPYLHNGTFATLPAPNVAGALARVTDAVRGIWQDTGTQWYEIQQAANVREFGAKGDSPIAGTTAGTDDTASFQAAINAVGARGGGGVFVPPPPVAGAYTIAGLAPVNNVRIFGAGFGSIIKGKAFDAPPYATIGNYYNVTPVNNVTIEHLQINGNKQLGMNRGSTVLLNGSQCRVANCYIHDSAEAGVGIQNTAAGTGQNSIVNNVFYNCAATPSQVGNQFYGAAYISAGENCIFSNNIVKMNDGQGNYGLLAEPNITQSLKRVIYTGNIIMGGTMRVIAVGPIEEVLMVGNYVNGIGTSGGGAVVRAENVTGGRLVITGNSIVANNSSQGIRIIDSDNPFITGNFVTGMGNAQNVNPSNRALDLENVIGGAVTNNYFHAAAPTHATANAGIDYWGGSGVQFSGNIYHPNIINRGNGLQSGWIVTTAGLPAAHADYIGLDLIEDAGAGVYNRINYVTASVRLRNLTAF